MMKQLMFAAAMLAAAAGGAAAPASVDSMAQRTAACAACHGEQGRATAAGYFPRIAGKPQGYLYNQLLNFRSGRRVNPAMNSMVAHLPDAYLSEIAGYFASLHPPHGAPQAAQGPVELGRRLAMEGAPGRVAACVACHGQALGGAAPSIPGLLGLPRDYVVLQLSAWRRGTRRAAAPDCMGHVAQSLTGEEVLAVAAWLSSRPVPPGYGPAPALARPLPVKCGGVQ